MSVASPSWCPTSRSRDGLHLNDVSYGCIARLLADSLTAAARAVPPPEEGAAASDDTLGPPAPR